jgi:hypothetical protein
MSLLQLLWQACGIDFITIPAGLALIGVALLVGFMASRGDRKST